MGRITNDLRKTISDTQDKVLSALAAKGEPITTASEPVIGVLAACDEAKAEARFGAAGKSLRRFATTVATRHPDVAELAKMPAWGEFAKDVDQAVNGSVEDAGLKDRLVKDYKAIVRGLACVKPRMVDDPLKRSDARDVKRQIKHVGMKQVYMLGENGFYGKPDNFDMYVRGSTSYLEEIGKLKTQQEVFVAHGMSEVSHTVAKRMKTLEEMRDDCHLGFHRIKPSDAAVIAARMHGLKWHELHFLTVPFGFFDTNYWPEVVADKKEEDKSKDDLKRLLVMKDKKLAFVDSVAFTYQPRLYPLAKFGNLPKAVAEVITKVESMPELNGCPVFDYYWVLVPSININHPYFRHKDGWKVRARRQDVVGWTDLEMKSYTDEYDAALALDQTLVCDGYFMPVVLGERDGKCHFLCLWR